MRNLQELQAVTDQEMILKLLSKFREQSTNTELRALTDGFIRICSYIAGMENERLAADRLISQSQMAEMRCVARAQKAEGDLRSALSELKALKERAKIFGID